LLNKKNFQNFLLVLASTIVTVLCVEIAVRFKLYLSDRATLDSIRDNVVRPAPGEEVKLGNMIVLSDNPNIMYEFQPDLFVRFIDQPVTINADGFRGERIAKEKPEGTVRIVGLGDSQMFGWGVKDDETYLAILSALLNEHVGACTWEIVNTAVPGYNTVMELETLKVKGLAYEPDFVVVGFIPNDLNLPQFTRRQENYLNLRKSFLYAYLSENLQSVNLLWHDPVRWEPNFDADLPDMVPEEHRHMVGKQAYRDAMAELQQIAAAHDFEVAVVIPTEREPHVIDSFIREVTADLGFHLLELNTLWEAYAADNAIEDPDNARHLSAEDPHASAPAHEAMALGLFDLVRQRDLCEAAR